MVKTLEKKSTKPRATTGNGKTKSIPKAATYADGRPQDQVQYFDAKLILKPDPFSSVRGFKIFSDIGSSGRRAPKNRRSLSH